jgi:hypothetical protein
VAAQYRGTTYSQKALPPDPNPPAKPAELSNNIGIRRDESERYSRLSNRQEVRSFATNSGR